MKIKGLLATLAAELFLTGCAAFQTSTTQNLPTVADGKPTANKALITVEGGPSYSGMTKLYAVKVYDNKTLVGRVGPHGKLVWQRDPGRMVLTLGDDSVYGSNWCLGRVHTVAASQTYNFKIGNKGILYSITGPGISIEDEQTLKFLAAWKQLRNGMSDVEVFRSFGGYQIDSANVNEKTKIAVYSVSWYELQCKLGFYQGKLSDWTDLEMKVNCPKCGQQFIAKIKTGDKEILLSCPSCYYSFTPTAGMGQ